MKRPHFVAPVFLLPLCFLFIAPLQAVAINLSVIYPPPSPLQGGTEAGYAVPQSMNYHGAERSGAKIPPRGGQRGDKRTSCFLVLMAMPLQSEAAPVTDSTVYGVGVQLRIDMGLRRTTNYTLSVNLGIGRNIGKNCLLSYQFNANLYQGGLGNSMLYSAHNHIQLDLVNAFSLTVGGGHYAFGRPIYAWTPNYAQSLTNPYRHAATLSTNFVWNKNHRAQQIGAICLTSGDVMLGYYNDGMPFDLAGMGDSYDRYWTGGGFLHVIIQPTKLQGIIRFDKFTGFVRDAFELANLLRLRYALYSDLDQMAYNQGRVSLTVIHPSGVGFTTALYNQYDVQDLIHRAMRQAYHPNIYRRRIMLGAQYWHFINPATL